MSIVVSVQVDRVLLPQLAGYKQSKVDLNAAGSWETLYSGSGTFDKLEITRNNASAGANNNLWISAIRVDGTIL